MICVELDTCIDRPIDEVFAKLVDIQSYPEWMPQNGLFVSCRQLSDGPVGRGTRYSDETRLGTVLGDVCEFEPPRAVTFHYTATLFGRTAMEGWPGYVLESLDETATKVYHVARGRLFGPFKLLRPLVQRLAENERRRTVDALKQSLESEVH